MTAKSGAVRSHDLFLSIYIYIFSPLPLHTFPQHTLLNHSWVGIYINTMGSQSFWYRSINVHMSSIRVGFAHVVTTLVGAAVWIRFEICTMPEGVACIYIYICTHVLSICTFIHIYVVCSQIQDLSPIFHAAGTGRPTVRDGGVEVGSRIVHSRKRWH